MGGSYRSRLGRSSSGFLDPRPELILWPSIPRFIATGLHRCGKTPVTGLRGRYLDVYNDVRVAAFPVARIDRSRGIAIGLAVGHFRIGVPCARDDF